MLKRTRFFVFGAVVATPVVAFATITATTVVVSLLGDEEYEMLSKWIHHLREI